MDHRSKQFSKAYIELNSQSVTETGCWLWTGELKGGYGVFKVRMGDGKRKMYYAHRVSYEVHKGNIPDGLCALHTCDVPSCVRPEHLYAGTKKQNGEDMARRGREVKKHPFCGKGHPMVGDNLLGARGICKACRYAWKLEKYGHRRR